MAGASLVHHVIAYLWLIGVDLWLDCCLFMAGSSLTYLDGIVVHLWLEYRLFMTGMWFIYG